MTVTRSCITGSNAQLHTRLRRPVLWICPFKVGNFPEIRIRCRSRIASGRPLPLTPPSLRDSAVRARRKSRNGGDGAGPEGGKSETPWWCQITMLNLINKETRQIPAGRAILRSGQSPFRRASVHSLPPLRASLYYAAAVATSGRSPLLPGSPPPRAGMGDSAGNFTVSCISESSLALPPPLSFLPPLLFPFLRDRPAAAHLPWTASLT